MEIYIFLCEKSPARFLLLVFKRNIYVIINKEHVQVRNILQNFSKAPISSFSQRQCNFTLPKLVSMDKKCELEKFHNHDQLQ